MGSVPILLCLGFVVHKPLLYHVLKSLDVVSFIVWLWFSFFPPKIWAIPLQGTCPLRYLFLLTLCGWQLVNSIVLLFLHCPSLVLSQLLRGISSSTPARPFLFPEMTPSPVLPADDVPLSQDLEDPSAVCVLCILPLIISPLLSICSLTWSCSVHI